MGLLTFRQLAASLLPSAAVGAAAGALGARFSGHRESSAVALGSFVGTVLGFGVALVWTSQYVTGVRDSRWLASHPIDYA